MSSFSFDPELFQSQAKSNHKENRKLAGRLKKMHPGKLDNLVHQLHIEVFEEIDCLKCANCCRTLGPRITSRDLEGMAKACGMKPAFFAETYLRIDEDQDYVFKTMPCPFLEEDNYCRIYEDRPKACREYPHTDRRKFYQLIDLSIKNAGTCPAVQEIFSRLKTI
jgi:uncharacterized protein